MGIKFLCPSGHKLHVKGFLAGRKAICPKCGAKVIVPEKSDSGLASADDESVAIDASAGVRGESARSGDPFAGAQGAVWYVRPVSGGQYGPASSEVMQGWLAERRIGAGSLVWREGWTQWQNAAAVFPQIGRSPAVEVPAAVAGSGTMASDLAGATINGAAGAQRLQELADVGQRISEPGSSETNAALARSLKRRRQTDASVIASAVLAGLSIILVVMLYLVIERKNNAPDASGTHPPTAATH